MSQAVNLIKGYSLQTKDSKRIYKNKYNSFLSAKGALSTTQFLTMYTLYALKTKKEETGEPSYGKEILDEVRHMINSETWNISHGTLYPVLTSLESNGLIERVESEDLVKLKNKKYYQITEDGIEAFEQKKDQFKKEIMSSSAFYNSMMNKFYKL